jgi:KaiC/GvpD/RAD55 family RecA-like ATPase/CheY-like chemotaxis protein
MKATPQRPAVYFTVLGEPPLKMLRYQQQYEFFDAAKLNSCIRFVNLGKEAIEGGLDAVLARIVKEVEQNPPRIVVVDSFRSIVQAIKSDGARVSDLQPFVQELAVTLTGWEATTFLVGEYQPSEAEDNPIFTVADGLLWLYQSVDQNSMVRKVQVMKLRGQAPIPGLHTFRISDKGIQVFPRLIIGTAEKRSDDDGSPSTGGAPKRLSTGVTELDSMLGGGIPTGYSVLVAGPSGSGKTVLATKFIIEGAEHGEPGRGRRKGPLPRKHRPSAGPGNDLRLRLFMRTVLIVDDDMDCREMHETALMWDGFRVVTAANGREALAVLEAERPCVILLDLMMPIMDGLTFLRERHRLLPRTDSVPVICVSAGGDELTDEAMRQGAVNCLPKPTDLDELCQVVAAYCP